MIYGTFAPDFVIKASNTYTNVKVPSGFYLYYMLILTKHIEVVARQKAQISTSLLVLFLFFSLFSTKVIN